MSEPSIDRIPENPALEGLETKWNELWTKRGTYRFDRAAAKASGTYSVDTPPPTASGSLHIGHAFSYTHTDVIARYKRMNGFEVFYPMGWDDNGLPTERRVQNYFGVRCDPSIPYDPTFEPPQRGGDNKSSKAANQLPISRRNFIELCEELTVEDEKQFEDVWRTLGLSVDWNLTYRTIGEESLFVSQLAFLRNLERGEAYQALAPTLWDVTFRTAVAQAELEDREQPGAYHDLAFHGADQDVRIATTRPELLPSCVALVAHPDDERYQHLFGTTVRTPIFDVEVPVLAHRLAERDKGTGIAMICTFGDTTDVTWWRELSLPNRSLLGFDGRFQQETPDWITSERGVAAYEQMARKTVFSARQVLVDLLRDSGELLSEPKKITHPVKFFEKGDKPLEIVSTRQWYIRNGANDPDLKEHLLEAGRTLQWFPEFMRVRYENWVNGLAGDWLISRQRYFGVPIPVWYAIGEDGTPDFDHVLTPTRDQLPVDPSVDVPPGYTAEQRGAAGGFVGEVDIMDTWATSSLTPQIVGGWERDPELWKIVSPFSLRPQAQDIIRTWLFSTVLRAQLEDGALPWTATTISGFIVDPDRKKMSKSKGNVVTPLGLLQKYSSDAVRYWAASSKLGSDAAFDQNDPKQIKIGRRLAIKLLNAAKLVYGYPLPSADSLITQPLDIDMLGRLSTVVEQATSAFERYDFARALEVTEQFFWEFCDDYLELVKERAYGSREIPGGQASAILAMRRALDILLRLFAPFLVYTSEEVWSWTHEDSVHLSEWPTPAEATFALLPADIERYTGIFSALGEALIGLRRVKTDAKVPQRTPLTTASLAGPAAQIQAIEWAADDLKAVARITGALTLTPGADTVTVTDAQLGEIA